MNNQDWRKYQKETWPERSLERVLASEGCSSVLDLLKKKLDSKDDTALQTSSINLKHLDNAEYVEMRMIIQELTQYSIAYNKLDDATRQRLGRIPLKTIDDARFWKDAVLKAISKLGE